MNFAWELQIPFLGKWGKNCLQFHSVRSVLVYDIKGPCSGEWCGSFPIMLMLLGFLLTVSCQYEVWDVAGSDIGLTVLASKVGGGYSSSIPHWLRIVTTYIVTVNLFTFCAERVRCAVSAIYHWVLMWTEMYFQPSDRPSPSQDGRRWHRGAGGWSHLRDGQGGGKSGGHHRDIVGRLALVWWRHLPRLSLDLLHHQHWACVSPGRLRLSSLWPASDQRPGPEPRQLRQGEQQTNLLQLTIGKC